MLSNLRSTIEVKFGAQIAFAKAAPIDLARLSRIVNQWTLPTRAERERFAAMLKVDTDWLFRSFTIPAAARSAAEGSHSDGPAEGHKESTTL